MNSLDETKLQLLSATMFSLASQNLAGRKLTVQCVTELFVLNVDREPPSPIPACLKHMADDGFLNMGNDGALSFTPLGIAELNRLQREALSM